MREEKRQEVGKCGGKGKHMRLWQQQMKHKQGKGNEQWAMTSLMAEVRQLA